MNRRPTLTRAALAAAALLAASGAFAQETFKLGGVNRFPKSSPFATSSILA